MRLSISALLFLVIFTFSQCGEESGPKDNFDRSLILTNVSANLILPAYTDFDDKIDLLIEKVEAFQTDPSSITLSSVQTAWFNAKKSWMHAEAFNFGPVDNLALETSIDLWPTSASGIETAIDGYNSTTTYLNGIGSNKKGLPAIEYLLFHDTEENIITEFDDENRVAYLGLLADALKSHITAILTAWDSYQTSFNMNVGNDANASMTLLANELIMLTEKVKNYKVATPLGLTTLSDPLPDQVESRYAGKSLELIDENLEIIEDVFTGGTGVGFDDYLDELNIEGSGGVALSTLIKQQIAACKASRLAITIPLEEAIFEEDAKVEQLFIDLQKLTVYFKTDMMSRLGLLVIFSDNDGD